MQPNSRSSLGRLQILAEVWCLPHRAADATCFTGRMVGPSIGSYATRGGSQSTGGHGLLRLWVTGGQNDLAMFGFISSKFSITKKQLHASVLFLNACVGTVVLRRLVDSAVVDRDFSRRSSHYEASNRESFTRPSLELRSSASGNGLELPLQLPKRFLVWI